MNLRYEKMLGFPSTNHRSRHRCEIRTGNVLLRSSGPLWRWNGERPWWFFYLFGNPTIMFLYVFVHIRFLGWGGNLRQKHVSKISSMIFTINSFQRSSVSWVFKTAYRILVRILLLTAPPLQNRHCVDDFSVFYCWTHTVRHQPFLVLKTGWKWWWHTNFVPQGTKTNLKYGGEINV